MSNQIIPGCGVHHIALGVSDLQRSLKFYEALGFSPVRHWKSGEITVAMIDIGNGTCLEVFSDCKGEAPADKTRGAYFHLALSVRDAADAYRIALEAGASPKKEPALMTLPSQPPFPAVIAFVYGPDGEQIEFFQPQDTASAGNA